MNMYKIAFIIMLMCNVSWIASAETVNVYEDIPYQDETLGKRKIVDEDYLLVMQAALKPGQSVPQHNADSNVHLLVVEGDVVVDLNGEDFPVNQGSLLPVANGTPMNVRNESDSNASFLIFKTPNPLK